MDPGLVRDVLTAALGLATGVLSGLFGVGGGVISQPGMRLLGIEPLIAIGTALPAIIPGAASGTFRYAREGLIRWPAVIATVPAGLLAAVAGGFLAEEVPGDGHLLQFATAVLLGFSAWRMSRPAVAPPAGQPLAESDAPEAPAATPTETSASSASTASTADGGEGASLRTFAIIGVTSGLLSGLLGIGGGVLMVPAFVHFARMPVKTAIATSLACVGAFAIPGTLSHAIEDHVAWGVAAALVVGVVPGARLGAHLAINAGDRRLRLVVAGFLGLTAVLYAAGELAALVS